MNFVTSWDDGHPKDQRIADLLFEFGLNGTFYIPISNKESKPVMNISTIRELDKKFEIGSHTYDHSYLLGMSKKECSDQIQHGKDQLEQILGHEVKGFCYPGGKYSNSIIQVVKESGFEYARTIENLSLDSGEDRWKIPTTLQFYPHNNLVLLKNYIHHGNYINKYPIINAAIKSKNFMDFLLRIIEITADTESILHIWGHSWEIDKLNLWVELRSFLKSISTLKPRVSTVYELSKKIN